MTGEQARRCIPSVASMQWLRRNLRYVIPAGIVAVVAASYLAFGVFGVHLLFVDDEVNEAAPVFDSGAGGESVEQVGASTSSTTDPSGDGIEEAPTATDSAGQQNTNNKEKADAPAQAAGESAPPTSVVPAEPQILSLYDGTFVPRSHPGEGSVSVLNDGSAQRFLRFDDFSTDNGPDLNVYLTRAGADAEAGALDDDFVDLGDLKGNVGPQNYEIPLDVDLDEYGTVVVWCVRFGVAFTAADLIPTEA